MEIKRTGFWYNVSGVAIPVGDSMMLPGEKIHSSNPGFALISQRYENSLVHEYSTTAYDRQQVRQEFGTDTVIEPKTTPEVEADVNTVVEPEVEPVVEAEVTTVVEPEVEPEVDPVVTEPVEAEVTTVVEPEVEPEVKTKTKNRSKNK